MGKIQLPSSQIITGKMDGGGTNLALLLSDDKSRPLGPLPTMTVFVHPLGNGPLFQADDNII